MKPQVPCWVTLTQLHAQLLIVMLLVFGHHWLVAAPQRPVLTAGNCAAWSGVFVWSGPCRPEGARLGDADDDAPDISELELEDPDDEVMTRRQLPATRHLTVAVSTKRLCHLQYALFFSASSTAHPDAIIVTVAAQPTTCTTCTRAVNMDNSIVSSAWALLSLASMAGYAVGLPQRRQHFLQAHRQVQQQQQDH